MPGAWCLLSRLETRDILFYIFYGPAECICISAYVYYTVYYNTTTGITGPSRFHFRACHNFFYTRMYRTSTCVILVLYLIFLRVLYEYVILVPRSHSVCVCVICVCDKF